MPIMLPDKKIPPVSDLSRFSILIHGAPKIGKSTFCADFKDTLFLAFEPGLNSLDTFQIPIEKGQDVIDIYELLKNSQESKRFSTVVFDTVDIFYGMCTKSVCLKHNIEYEGDLGYGKGFALAQAKFKGVLNMFASLPHGLVLVSHSKETEIETRTGNYKKMIPTLPGKAKEIVTSLVDIILYFDVTTEENKKGEKEEKRVIRTKFNKYYEAGDRTGVLPEEIEMDYSVFGKTFNEGMANKRGNK